jgi:hypothetical protein
MYKVCTYVRKVDFSVAITEILEKVAGDRTRVLRLCM